MVQTIKTAPLDQFMSNALRLLEEDDPYLSALLNKEYVRQQDTLAMVAAAGFAHPSVFACQGTTIANITTEGYPGARYHGGCQIVDQVEELAIERAKAAFHAQYANVQPHSGTSANQIVLFSILSAGDTLLGLELNSGGHLTHGAKASLVGQYFNAISYGVDEQGFIDYTKVYELALLHRPKLLICGASSYPRYIDFQRFRAIADEVGAFLLADISHISGLVVAGLHPSPIDHAHFTTTSTYKQLCGPRGGLILMGKDAHTIIPEKLKTLIQLIQQATFPMSQGTPDLGAIAAKARALDLVTHESFRHVAKSTVRNARSLANRLQQLGYTVLTGGTDNHLILLDLSPQKITGIIAQQALEECGIIVNKNRIPHDIRSAMITSGLRLGTGSLALRGMEEKEMELCAQLIHATLTTVQVIDDKNYTLDVATGEQVKEEVKSLCRTFQIPNYPTHISTSDKE